MIKQNLDPHHLLQMAQDVIAERGVDYGGIENNFQLVADLATLRLGRDFHPYEIAVIMACVKNARNFSVPDHLDSRVDGANYELFAAQFAADYMQQKAASGANLGYKKRVELQPAELTPLEQLPPVKKPSLRPSSAPKMPTPVQDAIQNALGRLDADG